LTNSKTSSDNAEMFLNLTLSTELTLDVLVASCDEKFLSMIESLLSSDEQIRIFTVKSGCDTLIACGKMPPDVLIIDEEIPDISPKTMINCLKKDTDLKNIKIVYCYESSETTNNSNSDLKDLEIDDYFNKANIDNTFLQKKLQSLLYTSSPPSHHQPTKQGQYLERRWPRTTLNIAAQVEMVMVNDPDEVDHGVAFLKNISRGGAYLSDLKLKKGLIPYEPYYVRLKVDKPPLKEWEAESIIVRFNPQGPTGIEFLNISKRDQLQIAKLFDR